MFTLQFDSPNSHFIFHFVANLKTFLISWWNLKLHFYATSFRDCRYSRRSSSLSLSLCSLSRAQTPVFLPLFRLLCCLSTLSLQKLSIYCAPSHTHTLNSLGISFDLLLLFPASRCLCLLAFAAPIGPHWGYVATKAIKNVRKSAKSQNNKGSAMGGIDIVGT